MEANYDAEFEESFSNAISTLNILWRHIQADAANTRDQVEEAVSERLKTRQEESEGETDEEEE